jgi:sec-independent protein translocase protein TatA
MPNIGPLEIAIVLVIVLLIFGPKRLPDLGRSLGSGMKNFKDSITGKDDDEKKPELAAEARSEAAEKPAAARDATTAGTPAARTGEPGS